MRKLNALIADHRNFLEEHKQKLELNIKSTETSTSYDAGNENDSGISSSDYDEDDSRTSLRDNIQERIDYVNYLESQLESRDIRIEYPVDYSDEESYLFFQIRRFNEKLIKLVKPFAEHITFSHYSPSIFDISEILENNTAIRSVTIDAEYFNSDLLTSDYFAKSVNSAINFYRLDAAIGEQDEFDEIDLDEVCTYLSGKINKNKALLIEWTCGIVLLKEAGEDEMRSFTYDDNVLDSSQEDDAAEENSLETFNSSSLMDKNTFNLQLIFQGIIQKHITYNGEIDKWYEFPPNLELIDHSQEFDGWRLIDYACYHGNELVIRELLRTGTDISVHNKNGERPLEIAAEQGQARSIATLLDLTFPITGRIIVSDKHKKQLQQTNKHGYTPLLLAVQKGQTEVVQLLLHLGANPNEHSPSGKTSLSYALDNQYYECAITLIQAGAYFPENFKETFEEINNDDLVSLCRQRIAIEKYVISGNTDELTQYIATGTLQHHFLTLENHSVPFVAFTQKQFDTYAFLRCKGFPLLDNEHSTFAIDLLDASNQKLLKKAMARSVNKHAASTIIFLQSKSQVLQPDPRYFEHLKEIYTSLTEIPCIKTVLSVLEYAGKPLDIIFDFESSNVEEISATEGDKVAGSCDYKDGRIFIGGKVEYRELLGTIAHELTHQAMQYLFENDCFPFPSSNSDSTPSIKDELIDASTEAQEKATDNIIQRVFTVYSEENRLPELIVRVPHMLAKYGRTQGEQSLQEQAPKLLKFFNEHVIPKCSKFISETQSRGLEDSIALETKLNQTSENDSPTASMSRLFNNRSTPKAASANMPHTQHVRRFSE